MFDYVLIMGIVSSARVDKIRPSDMLLDDVYRFVKCYGKFKESIFDLMGCDETFFKSWISFQLIELKNNMFIWKYYGVFWHILPFKEPRKKYDLKDPGVRRKFFNWSNWYVSEVYCDGKFDKVGLVNKFISSSRTKEIIEEKGKKYLVMK
jgi:hypothetical protein